MARIDIASGGDRRTHSEEHKAKSIGDLGQKGCTGTSNTVGVHKESRTLDARETQQNTIRSALVAGRNLTLDAKQDITVQGTDLRAGKDLTPIGQNLQLDPGRDSSLIKETSAMHQAGNTIGADGYVVDAVCRECRRLGGWPIRKPTVYSLTSAICRCGHCCPHWRLL
jgi:filamentous hemagglutinin